MLNMTEVCTLAQHDKKATFAQHDSVCHSETPESGGEESHK